MMAAISISAQTKRSDDFRAKYELKEVVVMSRHNIRSPLTSGGTAYMRVTPNEWFKWTSPSSQLSLRGGVLETETETENALELHTPIGSKLVFEKWSDGTEEYVAINLVYASLSQLQGCTLLSSDVPPMVLPVTVEGLTPNLDGLYRLADLDTRFAQAMAEYDAIEDATTDVPSATRLMPVGQNRAYTLNGTQVDDSYRGIVISDNQKVMRK